MAYRNLIDTHIHSDNSKDAKHSVTLICEKAVEKGLRAITVTDHCECLHYLDQSYNVTCRQSAFEVKKAAKVFNGQLVVNSGIELGNPTRNREAVADVMKNNFDFIVASVHILKGKKKSCMSLDYSREGNKPSLLLPRYFEELLEIAEWNGFDSLAHLTYPFRYMPEHLLADFDLWEFRDQIHDILKTLADNGKALEINTGGGKSYVTKTITSDMHPSLEIVKMFKELGGEYITVGSDAHNANYVGNKIEEAYDMAKSAGFKYITLYQAREPMPILID